MPSSGGHAPQRLAIRTPPASAPANGGSAAMIAAMRALDNRMNQSAVEKQSLKSGKAAPTKPSGARLLFFMGRNTWTVT